MSKIATVILLISYFLTIDAENRWLMVNRDVAKDYTIALLNQDISYKPDDTFIDYAVSADKGYVIFSEHNSNLLYGYFPDKLLATNSEKLIWVALKGNLFVARINCQ